MLVEHRNDVPHHVAHRIIGEALGQREQANLRALEAGKVGDLRLELTR